jgi:hypothetical protein
MVPLASNLVTYRGLRQQYAARQDAYNKRLEAYQAQVAGGETDETRQLKLALETEYQELMGMYAKLSSAQADLATSYDETVSA